MARTRITIYLLILAIAPIIWAPVYPVFYSLSADHAPLAEQFLWARPRYIYFGDSVLATSTECEKDHRSVIQMLPDAIVERTMGFNGGGDNANLWRDIARFVAARNDGSVKAAIIPINMGVFSLVWEHSLGFDFEQDRMFFTLASGQFSRADYIRYLIRVHSFSNAGQSEKAKEIADELPVMVGRHSIGRFEDIWSKANPPRFPCSNMPPQYAFQLGQRFALNYGAPVSPGDPYFRYLEEAIVRMRKADIHPIIYITPLNKQDIGRFGGPDVLAQLNTNLALVRSIAKQRGWDIIDLSATLPSTHFITRECGCEHVDSVGRALIARNVAALIRQDHL